MNECMNIIVGNQSIYISSLIELQTMELFKEHLASVIEYH